MTIEPGIGAVAFCGVVILTILAAEGFDPRLMWDAAGHNVHSPSRLWKARSPPLSTPAKQGASRGD